MAQDPNSRLSKNERRAQAREQARVAREQEKKREKRRRLYIQGGIVVGVLAVLTVIALVVFQSIKPAGPGPENMASGGVVFTENLEVVAGPALKDGETREAPENNREELPIDVTVYADYMCPACGAFEQEYTTMFENFVGAGDINLQVYPLTFQDPASLGTKYSTRAANLLGCVVEQQPEHAFALHTRLLSADVQPEQNTQGLSDDELLEQAEAVGASVDTELTRCVNTQQFGDFFQANTKAATESGIVGLAEGSFLALDQVGQELQPEGPQRLTSTPLVIVNGKQWLSARDGDLESYILKVMAEIEQKNGGADADAGAEAEAEGDSGSGAEAEADDESAETE